VGIGYPQVPVGFKNIRGYFISRYPTDKRAGNGQIFFAGRVVGKHYPYPTRPVAIPTCDRVDKFKFF